MQTAHQFVNDNYSELKIKNQENKMKMIQSITEFDFSGLKTYVDSTNHTDLLGKPFQGDQSSQYVQSFQRILNDFGLEKMCILIDQEEPNTIIHRIYHESNNSISSHMRIWGEVELVIRYIQHVLKNQANTINSETVTPIKTARNKVKKTAHELIQSE